MEKQEEKESGILDKTEEYGFLKPSEEDYFNIDYFNENSDIAEAEMKKASVIVGDLDSRTTVLEKNLYRPNLLINSNFKVSELVNQRRQSQYGTGGYIYDMWRLTNGSAGAYWDLTGDIAKVIFSEKGIGGYFLTTQYIENFKNLEGKTITLSIKVKKITGNEEGVVWLTARADEGLVGSESFQLDDNEWHIFSMTFTCPSEISESFRIYTNFSSWSDYEVEYLKLEVGGVATKFVDDDPATKLVKCQRYLQKFDTVQFIRVDMITTKYLYFHIDLSTQMRIKPTLLFGEEGIDWAIATLSNSTLSGFSLTQGSGTNKNSITLVASQTSHGLSDCIIKTITENNFLSAEL